jgi:hypothetical protein
LKKTSKNDFSRKEDVIKLRIDVDYAYPSRLKSFFCTAFGFKIGRNYLKNSKIIARMIDDSKKEVKAYWFFTHQTVPDRELLELLDANKQEVALHVATNPFQELHLLQKTANRQINYYTVHGTERLLGRLIWRRRLLEARASIPQDFPLKSFHVFPAAGIDVLCYDKSPSQVVEIAKKHLANGKFLHFHPEWLFQRGIINRRGPFYAVLKEILSVDKELDTLKSFKKTFFKMAKYPWEYRENVIPRNMLLTKLAERGVDVFTFIERKWCCTTTLRPKYRWGKTEDNIALMKITTYNDWWREIGKKTRNMVRKANKSGVATKIVEKSKELAEGIWNIYNETPFRQKRAFPHFGVSLKEVYNTVFLATNSVFVGAFLGSELVGFIQLVYGDKIAIIQQILSFQKYSKKAVNNALIAKTVEICASKQVDWLMYGRIGNHPSLDNFKKNNGFTKFPLTRYYVALTRKGRIAMRLQLHKEIKNSLPELIKSPLFPIFNWFSRNSRRLELSIHSGQNKLDT